MLRRKADEWRALREEHVGDGDGDDAAVGLFYLAIEASLRETAEALDVLVKEAA